MKLSDLLDASIVYHDEKNDIVVVYSKSLGMLGAIENTDLVEAGVKSVRGISSISDAKMAAEEWMSEGDEEHAMAAESVEPKKTIKETFVQYTGTERKDLKTLSGKLIGVSKTGIAKVQWFKKDGKLFTESFESISSLRKMNESSEDDAAVAKQIGKDAFHRGDMRVPGQDKELNAMMKNGSDHKTIMAAWLKGWDGESQKQPVTESSKSEQDEMKMMLVQGGYDNPEETAKKLSDEGMGPEELEVRIKTKQLEKNYSFVKKAVKEAGLRKSPTDTVFTPSMEVGQWYEQNFEYFLAQKVLGNGNMQGTLFVLKARSVKPKNYIVPVTGQRLWKSTDDVPEEVKQVAGGDSQLAELDDSKYDVIKDKFKVGDYVTVSSHTDDYGRYDGKNCVVTFVGINSKMYRNKLQHYRVKTLTIPSTELNVSEKDLELADVETGKLSVGDMVRLNYDSFAKGDELLNYLGMEGTVIQKGNDDWYFVKLEHGPQEPLKLNRLDLEKI